MQVIMNSMILSIVPNRLCFSVSSVDMFPHQGSSTPVARQPFSFGFRIAAGNLAPGFYDLSFFHGPVSCNFSVQGRRSMLHSKRACLFPGEFRPFPCSKCVRIFAVSPLNPWRKKAILPYQFLPLLRNAPPPLYRCNISAFRQGVLLSFLSLKPLGTSSFEKAIHPKRFGWNFWWIFRWFFDGFFGGFFDGFFSPFFPHPPRRRSPSPSPWPDSIAPWKFPGWIPCSAWCSTDPQFSASASGLWSARFAGSAATCLYCPNR